MKDVQIQIQLQIEINCTVKKTFPWAFKAQHVRGVFKILSNL